MLSKTLLLGLAGSAAAFTAAPMRPVAPMQVSTRSALPPAPAMTGAPAAALFRGCLTMRSLGAQAARDAAACL